MRALGTIYALSARSAVATRSSLLLSLIATLLRLGVVFAIYAVVYARTGGTVKGLPLNAALWSMAAYFIMLAVRANRLSREVSRDIQQGAVEVRIGKPTSYVGWMVASCMGTGLPHFVLTLVAAGAMTWLIVGAPQVAATPAWALAVLALAAGGLAIAVGLYTLIGLCAFWIEESEPVYWLVDKSVMVLGGSFVPVALFPDWLRTVADATPLGAVMFVTRAFTPDFAAAWPRLLLLQLAWALVLGTALLLTWRRAAQKLSVNGG